MQPSPDRDHAFPAAANPASTQLASHVRSDVRLPGEDGGHSLAEIARRDLDAALQLLADRAQYITGASGAAIALRRNGKKDMQCRASTGSNAPELGALLSTEFGLSGESVRTRQPLRCDDAERDVRVNREVCRQLGIASVVVMPVVNDDEVLGVFELFSGEVNAFGERDLSAVRRLSEMVETAVRLAEAAESLPERLWENDISAAAVEKDLEKDKDNQDKVLAGEVLEDLELAGSTGEEAVAEELVLEDVAVRQPEPVSQVAAEPGAEKAGPIPSGTEGLAHNAGVSEPQAEKVSASSAIPEQARTQKAEGEAPVVGGAAAAQLEKSAEKSLEKAKEEKEEEEEDEAAESAVEVPPMASVNEVVSDSVAALPPAVSPQAEPAAAPSVEVTSSRKQLFWTATPSLVADAGKPEAADQSHVPPVLRNLHKCEACGFPVSAGRALCVECEEKKWKLKVPLAEVPRQDLPSAVLPVAAGAEAPSEAKERTFAAAARSVAAGTSAPFGQAMSAAPTGVASPIRVQPDVEQKESKTAVPPAVSAGEVADSTGQRTTPASSVQTSSVQIPAARSSDFVLSGGLERSESWLSANKYVIGVLLVIAALVVAVLLLR